ncbi:aspartate/glutamate racemase family protein [Lichenihabitans sp. PAMC28606]|uniref:aspartate/glutamate racemase family protein n=1 Tax=Lichenihabitans sp. PAMC28606 TaxID=2880932 RepID=UPI001D09EF36|nr:aspartate/glutamate racemase family protein [Lichenihabitans sp. PAMC28606]UDL95993.1 aspartate/glutamate racemase family protein [Lichenihabitans sp. PAMC28606]
MDILLLNPNTSDGMTARMLSVAQSHAAPGTTILSRTAPRGVPYISTRAEALVGGAIALEMLAAETASYDAVIMAAVGDPGVGALREMLHVPVVGMAEAAMLTACMLGRRFAIVTFATALTPWFRECVEHNGLTGRLSAIRCLAESFISINDVQSEKEEALVALANQVVADTETDVVILAGAPLSGLAERVKHRIPVPVVDGIAAAVKQAEAVASLHLCKASAGSFRRPGGKPSQGLEPGVARWLGGAIVPPLIKHHPETD